MARKTAVARSTAQKPNSHGGWVPKLTRSQIHQCPSCSTKYIKTREGQRSCIKCIYALPKR